MSSQGSQHHSARAGGDNMAFDSTANLIFTVAANTDDAVGNVQRFRALLTKDLSGIAEEFSSWSAKTFGDLTTVAGAMTGLAAAGAAAMVAVGGALLEAANKAAEYDARIEEGMHRTGLTAEQMSGLAYAAKVCGIEYNSLTSGLTRFESQVVKAGEGSQQAASAFSRLGITQEQIQQGEKNVLPLLFNVADSFHSLQSATEKAAMARDLFGRGGAEFIAFLQRGSDGIKALMQEADRLGLTITEKDILASKGMRIELGLLKSEVEGLTLSVGNKLLPILIHLGAGLVASTETLTTAASKWGGIWRAASEMPEAYARALADLEAKLKGALIEGSGSLGPPEKTLQDYTVLSDLVMQLTGRIAALGTAENKIAFETIRLTAESDKAAQKLQELHAQGQIGAEAFARESEALKKVAPLIEELAGLQTMADAEKLANSRLAAVTELQTKLRSYMTQSYADRQAAIDEELQQIHDRYQREGTLTAEGEDLIARIRSAAYAKLAAEQDAALSTLRDKLQSYQQQGYAEREAAFSAEIDQLRQKYQKEGQLTTEAEELLAQIRTAGLRKIETEREQAFAQELIKLQQHQAQMISSELTARQRIEFAYYQDLEKFGQVEEEKALLLAKTEGEQQAVRQQFSLLRDAALQKYQAGLQALRNSTGWRGIFGDIFAQSIRGNEALWREWQQSANQSMMLVRVSIESLAEEGGRAFQSFAQGMAQNIAQAVVYKQSIGDAMRAALAATLESIAAKALVESIYATALGFLELAEFDYEAAANAFTAAAIFGSVGLASAVAGSAAAPKQGPSAAPSGTAGTSGLAAASGAPGGAGGAQAPYIQVNVQTGHVIGPSGIEELAGMINDAVQNRDVRLIATQTRQSSQVTK